MSTVRVVRFIVGVGAISRRHGPSLQVRPFDLTPCFEEGILLSTLLVLFLIAAITKWSLLAVRHNRERTRKSRWILRIKLVSIFKFILTYAYI